MAGAIAPIFLISFLFSFWLISRRRSCPIVPEDGVEETFPFGMVVIHVRMYWAAYTFSCWVDPTQWEAYLGVGFFAVLAHVEASVLFPRAYPDGREDIDDPQQHV